MRRPDKPGDCLTTPPHVLDLVRKVGPIGFDPFPNALATVNPRIDLQTALWDAWEERNWTGGLFDGEVLWVQPPYSSGNLPRCADAWAAQRVSKLTPTGGGCHAIALVPARPGANWYATMREHSNAICEWRGRIVFHEDGKPTKGGGRFDSVLFYRGARPHLFCDVFQDSGDVRVLR